MDLSAADEGTFLRWRYDVRTSAGSAVRGRKAYASADARCGKATYSVHVPYHIQGRAREAQKTVAVHTGSDITVRFDRPTPLQVDGETHVNVTEYSAY